MARGRSRDEHDPSRREFFRTFGRQTLHNAGAVAGAAAELRRTSLAAARELLEMDPVAAPDAALDATQTRIITPAETSALPAATFRSAYRFTGDELILLDQRLLPGRVETFAVRDASEAAAAMRAGAVTPGPVLAQIAAYSIVLAAAGSGKRSAAARDQVVKAAIGALRGARPEVHALGVALDRMEARFDALANAGVTDAALRDGLTQEADAIAIEATADHAAVGRAAADYLARRARGARQPALQLLMHADSGPLSSGMVGPGTAALQLLREDGIGLHVWLPAALPSGEGERIAALQLTQLDIPHTLIPDAAIGWLLANRRLDATVLRADTVVSNRDVATLVGGRGVAQLSRAAEVPVIALASRAAFERDSPDATHLAQDWRSTVERGTATRGRLNPGFDIVPVALVDRLISASAG